MSEKPGSKKKEEPKEDDPFDIPDVDETPAPQEFQRPKWLMNLKPQAEKPDAAEVRSGAAQGTPPPLAGGAAGPPPRPYTPPKAGAKPPTPKGADVAMDKPTPRTDMRAISAPDASTADIRIEKPQAANADALRRLAEVSAQADVRIDKPAPQAPNVEALRRLSESSFDVQPAVQKRPPANLRPLEEGPVEIVKPAGEHEKPKPVLPTTTGEFDVVVDATAKNPLSQHLKVSKPRKVVGVVDTTFARYNMGDAAHDEIQKLGGAVDVVRRTVPGIKDLAVECKILFEEEDCDLVIACGMVGGQPIDKQCAHEASLAIQWAMLQSSRHILEVFVHEDEAQDEKQLAWLMDRRTREHALNAVWMMTEPHRLREKAGQGLRQGFDDAGPVQLP